MSAPATMVAVLMTVTIQMVAIIANVERDIQKMAKTVMVSNNCLCVTVNFKIFDDLFFEQILFMFDF